MYVNIYIYILVYPNGNGGIRMHLLSPRQHHRIAHTKYINRVHPWHTSLSGYIYIVAPRRETNFCCFCASQWALLSHYLTLTSKCCVSRLRDIRAVVAKTRKKKGKDFLSLIAGATLIHSQFGIA